MNIPKRIGALFLAILVIVTSISAQNIKFEPSNFLGRENDLQNALSLIEQGEKLLFEAEAMLSGKGIDLRYKANAINMISKGLAYFLQANAFNPQSAQLNYTIGKSYLYVGDYTQALNFLRKAMLLDEKEFKDIYFLVGQVYQYTGDLELAVESYNVAAKNFGNETNWSNIISTRIRECRHAQELMGDAVDVRVENLGVAMNTENMEYFPIVTEGDELLFFERFSSGKNRLYAAERTPRGWKAAVETNQSFLLLPEKDKETLKELTLVDKNGVPAVTKWFTINVGSQQQINQDYYESVATSANSQGKTIAYFSSNRYEDAIGFDIFVSQNNKKGQWERPRSVSEINTEGDEYGVVLHPDGHTLYFSSNGHQTMGGYDIFKSEYDGKHWSKPENLGYPINSTADDIIYSISEDGNRLYFSSNRPNGKGGYDIYVVNFMPDVMPVRRAQSIPMNVSAEAIGIISTDESLTSSEVPAIPVVAPSVITKYPAAMHGFISDNQTYIPLGNVTLRLLDKSNNAEEVIETDSKGTFYTTLSAGGSYRIVINIPGYQTYEEDFKLSEEVGQKLSKNIGLMSLAGENEDLALAEQLKTVAPESEESYEEVVVLTPVLANEQPESQVETEYPVAVAGLITDNETFVPIQAAKIKVMLKDSDDEHIFESDGNGLVNFYLASGNTYVVTASAGNYEDYVEEFVLAQGPEQKLSKTFQLQAIPLAVMAEEIIERPDLTSLLEAEALMDEESTEEPMITAPIVELVPVPVLVEEPEPEPEPVVFVEPVPEPQEVQPEPELIVSVEPVLVPVPVVVPEPEPVVELVAEEPKVQSWQFEEVATEEAPVQEPVQDDAISYEDDVVVLAPILALTEGNDSIVENREYPVDLKIYVSDNQTLLPLAVSVKLTVKNTDINNMLNTDERGMLDVTVASGNAYQLTVEHEGYIPVVEDFDVAKGPGQTLTRNIVLSSLTPVVTPEIIVAETRPIAEEEAPEPEVVSVVPAEEELIIIEEVSEPEVAPVIAEPIEEAPEPEVTPVTLVEEEPVVVEVTPEPVVEEPVEETPVKKTPVTEKVSPTPSASAVIALSGTIVNADTRKPVIANVVLTDATRGITEVIKVSNQGKFNINTLAGSNYSIKVTAEGYQTVVKDITTSTNDKTVNMPVELYPVTETFVAAIYFDFDRAALNDKAEQTLQEAIALLKQGKKVYLIGYSDNAGGYGYNKRLSERRVETVNTYLRIHGITPEATSWKGFFNPAETNFTISGRKLNNRVEIWTK
jgi:outer membrane protein OmpA-like peptidoglycan-associated protein/tetratricopeptide (TPR) repeat protein